VGSSQKKGEFIPIILSKGRHGVVRGQPSRILAINSGSSSIKFALYTVVVIGFFGAQPVYSGWSLKVPAAYKAGEKLFKSRCSGCRPHGGNIIVPNLPLRSAPELAEFKTFEDFIRNPKMPDGSRGACPLFLLAGSRLRKRRNCSDTSPMYWRIQGRNKGERGTGRSPAMMTAGSIPGVPLKDCSIDLFEPARSSRPGFFLFAQPNDSRGTGVDK
jgi:hypothetical protein